MHGKIFLKFFIQLLQLFWQEHRSAPIITDSGSLFLRIHVTVTVLFMSGLMSKAPFSLTDIFQVAKG